MENIIKDISRIIIKLNNLKILGDSVAFDVCNDHLKLQINNLDCFIQDDSKYVKPFLDEYKKIYNDNKKINISTNNKSIISDTDDESNETKKIKIYVLYKTINAIDLNVIDKLNTVYKEYIKFVTISCKNMNENLLCKHIDEYRIVIVYDKNNKQKIYTSDFLYPAIVRNVLDEINFEI